MNSTQILINIGLGFLTIFVFGGILALIKWVFKSITDKINDHAAHIVELKENSVRRPELNNVINRLETKMDTQHVEQRDQNNMLSVKIDNMSHSLHGAQQAFIAGRKL